ncbi:hemolysin III family protein [Porticoccaceae bacterium]|nr:hemolysin III family protein [Porticoccaceae bacterium]
MALGALVTVSVQTADPWIITSFSIFGVSLVLLYTMSTLYHSFRATKLKQLFQLFDHIAIYLLIAGTYTPFMLVDMRDSSGWWMMAIIWSLALLGIISEIFFSGRGKVEGISSPSSEFDCQPRVLSSSPLFASLSALLSSSIIKA